jgi:hypothetical protein
MIKVTTIIVMIVVGWASFSLALAMADTPSVLAT